MKNHLHHFTALVLLLLLSPFVRSQQLTEIADVHWGQMLNNKVSGRLSEIFGEQDGNTYSRVYFRNGNIHVQKMNSDLTVIYSVPLEIKFKKKPLKLNHICLVGDRILVLTSLLNKNKGTQTLYLRSFNAADMSAVSDFTELATIAGISSKDQGDYWVRTSPDGQKVLVGMEKPSKKGSREEFGAKVFDKNMNGLWSADFTLPYTDDEFVRTEHYLDNDGSVMVLGIKYPEKAEQKSRKHSELSAYDHHLLIYKPNDITPDDHLLSTPDRRLEEIVIAMDNKNGNMICAGLYGDRNTIGIKGPFQFTFDRNSKRIKMSTSACLKWTSLPCT